MKNDYYHSILIVSSSESVCQMVKKSLKGFVTMDVRKSASHARRCILERYYDIVVIDTPLADETGEDFAIDVTSKCNASVLFITPQDAFENVIDRLAGNGILTVPKPLSGNRIDRAVRFLVATQNKIHEQEKKVTAIEEKMEDIRSIDRAKFMLMEKKHMTEDKAHKYIGKQAMDRGVSRGKAARRILDELE